MRPLTSRRIAQEQPGLYKTHDCNLVQPGAREPAIPADAIDRVVYVIRDPRDVAISAAHHFGWSLATSVDRTADASFRLGRSSTRLNVNVEQWVSSWSAHVESWLDAGDLHLMPLRYEDLLAGPVECFTSSAGSSVSTTPDRRWKSAASAHWPSRRPAPAFASFTVPPPRRFSARGAPAAGAEAGGASRRDTGKAHSAPRPSLSAGRDCGLPVAALDAADEPTSCERAAEGADPVPPPDRPQGADLPAQG